jgi:peptidoglycan/xylan/chitin deacetylase (PgdA/CDA1 family)
MIKKYCRNTIIQAGASINSSFNLCNGGRIVALHDVPNAEIFRRKIEWLNDNYNIVSLEDILTGKNSKSQKNVAITFDDGYQNWLDNAVPVLEEFQVKAVFFTCSGMVGLNKSKSDKFIRSQLLRSQKLTSISQSSLREISNNNLFEIGGHTCNHINLGRTANEDDIMKQIKIDKELLEKWTGKELRWFAYPFGGKESFNDVVKDIVKRCGYASAFTILPNYVKKENIDLYEIGRDCLELDAPVKLWKNCLDGGYDVFSKLKNKWFK